MDEGSVKTRADIASQLIDRPRLTKMLDASQARAILLLAPAGYGKTTLARQWLGNGDKPVAWYRATQASSDVAGLAAGIARAAARLVPGAAEQLIQVIRNMAAPARDVDEVADAFVDGFGAFPSHGWLAIDDYHFLIGSGPAERFVEALMEKGPARILIASRRRPRWATVRRVMYGEIDEAAQNDLAFTDEEAALLLPHVAPAALTDFVQRAKGWPAVVKLASVTGERDLPQLELPPALHQYFAEELFQAASPAVQDALARLALLETLKPHLLEIVLGSSYGSLCEEAVALGFLTHGSEATYDFHPLLKAFLAPRARQLAESADLGRKVTEALIAEGDWDEAFAVVVSLQRSDMLPALFENSLDDLLAQSRISTLEAWTAYSTHCAAEFPLLDLAEAEVARRLGDIDVGELRALQAARTIDTSSRFCSRAWAVAGECANLASRPEDAAEFHQRAEATAISPRDVHRALWGLYLVAAQSELEDPQPILGKLKDLDDGAPATTLQIASAELHFAVLEGHLATAAREHAAKRHLISRAGDAFITTGFLNRLGWAQALSGDYAAASRTALACMEEAKQTSLQFVVPHMTSLLIAANIGLRRFRHAETLLDEFDRQLEASRDPFEEVNRWLLRGRLLLCQHQFDEAIDQFAAATAQTAPTPALMLEGTGLHLLALACKGNNGDAALAACQTALVQSREVQGVTLTAFARYVKRSMEGSAEAVELLAAAMRILNETENYDSFVHAYRAYPPTLSCVIQNDLIPRHALERILREANDFRLAEMHGVRITPQKPKHVAKLTAREYQVYELLCKSLSNREIAEALVISEMTAKVHVRHILDKLGAKSRTHAVLLAQEPL